MDSYKKPVKILLYNDSTGGFLYMAKKGTKHKTYSPEFKKEAVERYLSGELGGCKTATRRLGLKSDRQLRNWVKLYRKDPELLKQDNRGKASLKDGVRKGRPKQVKLLIPEKRNGSSA